MRKRTIVCPVKYRAIAVTTGVALLCWFQWACQDKAPVHASEACISGRIVGEKCGVFAFQPDKKGALGAQVWEQKGANGVVRMKNIIGIIDLSIAHQANDRLFLQLRKASTEEQLSIACYLDLPGPPTPIFVVEKAHGSTCPN